MALIPDDVIAEIRERTDIVAVIGQHVQLRKAGQNHKGLCPFHSEKTPSFNVNGSRRSFYCFGCQKGGDVFTFVTEYEGKSFVEAVQTLASRCGVTIPERPESAGERRARSQRERMYEANRVARDFFRECLLDPERGRAGQAYLRERGISPEFADKFELGYAPDDWRSLVDHLERARVSASIAEEVGLIVKQPRAGGFYTRFRHRLMCPVVVPGGQVAGFSGRILPRPDAADDDGDRAGAKYINSPQTPVYKKSELLFGLHLARAGFRRAGRALLVEGNFDVVSLHQAGFDETVAPLGTALTEQQVDKLRRLTKEVVLLYDGDRAGRAATLKSLELFVAADVHVRIAVLPMGSDPDSVVGRGGAEALATILQRAQPGIEYFANEVWARSERSSDGYAEALAEAARVVEKVADPVKRDLITGTLAAAMSIEPGLVRRAMSRNRQARGPRRDAHPHAPPEVSASAPRARGPSRRPPDKELRLLELLVEHSQLFAAADAQDAVSLLTDERLRDMYCAARQGDDVLTVAPDDIRPLVARRVMSGSYANVPDPNHTLLEITGELRADQQRRELESLNRRVVDARRRGDKELERQLVRQILAAKKKVN